MSNEWTKGLVDWLQGPSNRPYLNELFNDIEERAVQSEHDALQPGDTEYKKGYAAALRFVAALPEQIVAQSTKRETVD